MTPKTLAVAAILCASPLNVYADQGTPPAASVAANTTVSVYDYCASWLDLKDSDVEWMKQEKLYEGQLGVYAACLKSPPRKLFPIPDEDGISSRIDSAQYEPDDPEITGIEARKTQVLNAKKEILQLLSPEDANTLSPEKIETLSRDKIDGISTSLFAHQIYSNTFNLWLHGDPGLEKLNGLIAPALKLLYKNIPQQRRMSPALPKQVKELPLSGGEAFDSPPPRK